MKILLLGGTSEASQMARALSRAGHDAVFSYAGRTDAPLAQPLAMRICGFGGVAGLVAYLRAEAITHLIDATHPFAAQMSRNACRACAETGIPYLALERAPWQAGPGDHWTHVADNAGACAALPEQARRIFLAIGKQGLADFADQPQHHYLLRLVDPPAAPLPLPETSVVLARGPFDLDGDLVLLLAHRIELIVAKNAGGTGARAKLDAARSLGLPVILIERPELPARKVVAEVEEALHWLAQDAASGST